MEESPFGRYRLLGLLGEGGMGRVYRAFDTDTERIVALKVLPPQFAHDPVYRTRFRREAQAAARLTEPHIIPIHGYGEIDGRLFLDMRLVEGTDLGSVLADAGRLPAVRAVDFLAQIAAALDAAHRAGLVHRDVKPSNILTTADGFAYLIDFGIARGDGDSDLTTVGAAIGTFAYMAPERLAHDDYDGRADVYALACVLYECLTGTRPFPGNSVERQIAAHLSLPPPRPSAAGGVPVAFDEVIALGMAKNPAGRYPTAGALTDAARTALHSGLRGPGQLFPSNAVTQINPLPAPNAAPPLGFGATADTQLVRPPAPNPAKRSLSALAWAAATAMALLIVAGVVLVPLTRGGDSGSRPGPASSSVDATPPSSPAATATPTSVGSRAADFLRTYYQLLPGDTATAWTRLTPRYQNSLGGYSAYQSSWGTVASVVPWDITVDTGRLTVTYGLHLTYTDGRTGAEQRQAQLVRNGDTFAIDSANLFP
ncbi:serine/threonine-protein kinase [Nocardia sp. NBC_01327]|uniref:serine/threonine-protein kinase n=1 Tax=Nocardia sp. NBC_01327 TaxID=2903593 RepID=UPI002E15C88E|nr:serine/threonine protein kinase [Nocardia sp. NBC_01327]